MMLSQEKMIDCLGTSGQERIAQMFLDLRQASCRSMY